MSIKDDVSYIKNELSSEEKFLESFVKLRFLKNIKINSCIDYCSNSGSIVFSRSKLDEKNLYEANIALSIFLKMEMKTFKSTKRKTEIYMR